MVTIYASGQGGEMTKVKRLALEPGPLQRANYHATMSLTGIGPRYPDLTTSRYRYGANELALLRKTSTLNL